MWNKSMDFAMVSMHSDTNGFRRNTEEMYDESCVQMFLKKSALIVGADLKVNPEEPVVVVLLAMIIVIIIFSYRPSFAYIAQANFGWPDFPTPASATQSFFFLISILIASFTPAFRTNLPDSHSCFSSHTRSVKANCKHFKCCKSRRKQQPAFEARIQLHKIPFCQIRQALEYGQPDHFLRAI